AGREQRAARRAGSVAKLEWERGVGAGDTVDARVAGVADRSARGLHGGDGDLPGVLHVDRDAGLIARGGDQPALYRERANPGEDIAAVLRVGDDRLVDENLQEQVVDVDPL